MDSFVELLKSLLPAVLILYAAYLMVRAFIEKEKKQLHAKVLEEGVKISLPLRLQAYERMCLFLERTSIVNLLPRVAQSGESAKELQRVLIQEIRDEYHHNLSQQLYISEISWQRVRAAMEEAIMLINRSADELTSEATQADFVRKIISYVGGQKYDSTAHALQSLKEEVKLLF